VKLLFINGYLWPLALLVALPLVVHLLARLRPRNYDFSSTLFIRRALRFTQRLRRPRDWLLLLLRTLLALVLLLLFLRPLLHLPGAGAQGVRRAVVVLLDASASMGWSDASQTRFAVACAETSEILAGLGSQDVANVILAGTQPAPLLPTVGSNLGYLQEELRRARLTAGALNLAAALELALEMVADETGRREIVIVSDFQADNWRDFRPQLPPGVTLTAVGVAQGEAENGALLRLALEPAEPLPGEEAVALCEVANFSAAVRRERVVLAVGASRTAREVVVEPWGRATVIFPQPVVSAQPLTLEARLEGDRYPLDDRRWLQVRPSAGLRVGLVTTPGGEASAATWRRGCQALGWVELVELRLQEEANSGDAAAEGRFDLLMLAGWDGGMGVQMRRWIPASAAVVWAPPAAIASERLRVLTGGDATVGRGGEVGMRRGKPMGLTVTQEDHAVFKAFARGEFGDPARGSVQSYLALEAAFLPEGEALMSYHDSTPALWLCRGEQPLLIWNIPLAEGESSFQQQGEFVPLLGELLLHLRRGAGGNLRRDGVREHALLPGEPLWYQPQPGVRAGDVVLRDESGRVVELEQDQGRGLVLATAATGLGIYSWSVAGEEVAQSLVNFPVTESDLRVLGAGEIRSLGLVAAGSGRELRRWQEGVQLWPRLLWLAMGLLVAEGLVLTSHLWWPWRRR